MSSLSNKYGISSETITKMVKDGVISCSWITYEEVYEHYKNILPKHSCKTHAVDQVCIDKNVSQTFVFRSIEKFE